VGGAILAPILSGLASHTRNRDISPASLSRWLVFSNSLAPHSGCTGRFSSTDSIAFLFAGTGLAGGWWWTVARWVFLGVLGAAAGCVIVLKERGFDSVLFQSLPFLLCRGGRVGCGSRLPDLAMFEALSLLLLFVYAATGARLRLLARSRVFFRDAGRVEILSNIALLPRGRKSWAIRIPRRCDGGLHAPRFCFGHAAERKADGSQSAFWNVCAVPVLVFIAMPEPRSVQLDLVWIDVLGAAQGKGFAQGLGAILILVAAYAIIQPVASQI